MKPWEGEISNKLNIELAFRFNNEWYKGFKREFAELWETMKLY